MSYSIDTFLTPFFPEPESLFEGSLVVMIDVLRASSTVAVALKNGAKEVIPTDSLEKAVKIYSSLSKEIRFLGGERNSLKPSGFDAGNSPYEYSFENVNGRTVILTTTNGSRIFQKAKSAKYRLVGSFINLSYVFEFILAKLSNNDDKISKIQFICAGNDGNFSYEDMFCAGMFINELTLNLNEFKLSDSSIAAMLLYQNNKNNYAEILKHREHSQRLIKIGFESDVDFCFQKDVCDVVPIIGSSSIKKYELNSVNN